MPRRPEDSEAWGGARPGAGRKSKEEKMGKHTVSLPENVVAYLKGLGDDNLSAGIRKCAERQLESRPRKAQEVKE